MIFIIFMLIINSIIIFLLHILRSLLRRDLSYHVNKCLVTRKLSIVHPICCVMTRLIPWSRT